MLQLAERTRGLYIINSFFGNWYSSHTFIFRKNVKITNIQYSELTSLLRAKTTLTQAALGTLKINHNSDFVLFNTSREMKTLFIRLWDPLPGPATEDPVLFLTQKAGALADRYGDMLAKTFLFDPYARSAQVHIPVFVVYGDYDNVVDDDGAALFLAKFAASPLKWRLRIDHGTHVVHLEKNRKSLYGSVAAFIQTVDATAQ